MRLRLKQSIALAWLTAVEALRQPIVLLLTLSCVVFVALLPGLIMHVMGEPDRLVRDSALAVQFVGGLLLAGYTACAAVKHEIQRGTVATVLTKPVGRTLFFLSKYAGVAFASFLVDYAVFLTLAYLLGVYYLLAHAIARVCSGTFNFLSNKHLVFKSRSRKLPEALRYLAAVAFSLAVTALLLYCLVDLLGVSKALAKPAAEFTMFLANFIVLHRFVFRK